MDRDNAHRDFCDTLTYELTDAGGGRHRERQVTRSTALRDGCGRLPRPPRLRDAIRYFDEMLWTRIDEAIRLTAGLLYYADEESPYCRHREKFFNDHLFYRQCVLGRPAIECFPRAREDTGVERSMCDAGPNQRQEPVAVERCQCRENRSVVIGKRGWLECRLLSVRCYGKIHRIPFIVCMANKCRLPAANNGELRRILDAEPTSHRQLSHATRLFNTWFPRKARQLLRVCQSASQCPGLVELGSQSRNGPSPGMDSKAIESLLAALPFRGIVEARLPLGALPVRSVFRIRGDPPASTELPASSNQSDRCYMPVEFTVTRGSMKCHVAPLAFFEWSFKRSDGESR